jgi:hypothetical protein
LSYGIEPIDERLKLWNIKTGTLILSILIEIKKLKLLLFKKEKTIIPNFLFENFYYALNVEPI